MHRKTVWDIWGQETVSDTSSLEPPTLITGMLMRLVSTLLCAAMVCRADSYIEALKLSHDKHGSYYYGPSTEHNAIQQAASFVLPHSLDIFLILGKILLKLVIFKIIVKFFAIICLLLFIPTLKLSQSVNPMKDAVHRSILNDIETHLRESAMKYK